MVSLVVTAIAIAFLGRDRGSLVAAIVLVGLVAAKSPLLAIPFIAGIVLLVIERRWSEEGRLRLPWPRIHEALTLFVGVLFLVQVVQFATRSDPPPLVAADAWAGQPLNDAARPNIYLILADAHGREDVLRDDYDYDDRALLDALEGQGFDVSSESRSNYGLTRFSIGSMLDRVLSRPAEGRDVDHDAGRHRAPHDPRQPGVPAAPSSGLRGDGHLERVRAPRTPERRPVHRHGAAQRVRVGGRAEHRGDRPVVRAAARRQVRGRSAPARATRLAALLDDRRGSRSPSRGSSSRTCPSPHWPYVFTETCEPAHPIEGPAEGIGRGGGDPETVAAVAAQTKCIDTMLAKTTAEIVARDPNAVVIAFSDHGPDEHLDWWDPDSAGIAERSSNLFAARTPGHEALFPDDVTLVNVLPLPVQRLPGHRAADARERVLVRASPAGPYVRVRGPGMTSEGDVRATRRRPRRAFVIAAIAYVALAVGVGGPLVWPIVAPNHMLVIGHSGDVANWPRNTLHSVEFRDASRAPTASSSTSIARPRGRGGCSTTGTSPRPRPARVRSRSSTDAELSAIRLDGGMGVKLAAGTAPEGLARLTEVLDALAGYRGTIIVDCKDERPGAHQALAQFLRDRGLITSVIARSAAGAAEIKGVDPRFRVIAQQMITFDPNVDVWLADAGYEVVPPRTTIADLFGELGMFVGDSHWGQDETAYLDAGRRWGVQFVITNDIAAALKWRSEQTP